MKLLAKVINIIATSIYPTLVIDEQELELEQELKRKKNNSRSAYHYDYKKPDATVINPASGLPMVGGVDVVGNSFGTNNYSDDYHKRIQESSYIAPSISYDNSSQYDYWKN